MAVEAEKEAYDDEAAGSDAPEERHHPSSLAAVGDEEDVQPEHSLALA